MYSQSKRILNVQISWIVFVFIFMVLHPRKKGTSGFRSTSKWIYFITFEIFQTVPYSLCSFWLCSFKLFKNKKQNKTTTSKYVLFIGTLAKELSEAVEEWYRAQAPQSFSCAEACKHSLKVPALPKMGASCFQKLLLDGFMALNLTLSTPTLSSIIYKVLLPKSTYSLCASLLWKTVEMEQRSNRKERFD